MATRKPHGTVATETATPRELPEQLFVIEATLSVGSDDDTLAMMAMRGFEYLLAREFTRQHPALSLLYDLEFVLLEVRRGSRHFDFKVVARLKRRIKNAYKKATAMEIAGLIMAAPATLVSGFEVYDRLIPPVEQCLRSDLPQVRIDITQVVIRAADGREKAPNEPGDFTL